MGKQLKILYLGSGWSWKRANALKRLGHEVRFIDPLSLFPLQKLVEKLIYFKGGVFFEPFLKSKINSLIRYQRFDLTFIEGGELIGPSFLQNHKNYSKVIVHYTTDDPFGKRDRHRWYLYLKAVPYYDLLAPVRQVNVAEAYAHGAKKVVRVFMSIDELDGPREITPQDRLRFSHDVLCIATWMPERGPFLAELIKAGVPLTIYGNGWQKAPEWPTLQSAWQGPAMYGDDYIKPLQLAKVSLGLLSKGNRDLHTLRTFDIPYCGGLFCAERTSEHLALYQEDVEAVYWSDAKECIEKCQILLGNERMRAEIARKGRERCLRNGIFNETVLRHILETALY
ncbi:MAG: CgeB family protein [Thermodesulfobacteriota bacterium]